MRGIKFRKEQNYLLVMHCIPGKPKRTNETILNNERWLNAKPIEQIHVNSHQFEEIKEINPLLLATERQNIQK